MSYLVYWVHHKDQKDIFTQGYIGITNNFKRRMKQYEMLYGNPYLTNAIKKHGWDNLAKEVILIADKAYCLLIETQLRAKDAIGWNIIKGGGMPPLNTRKGYKMANPSWNKGMAWSDEIKQKVSLGVKKLWENPEYRDHMSKAHKGQQSPMAGKKHNIQSLKRMSESKIGKKQSKETIEKRIKQLKGKTAPKLICPQCNQIGGAGAMKRWHFDNCKLKGNKIC